MSESKGRKKGHGGGEKPTAGRSPKNAGNVPLPPAAHLDGDSLLPVILAALERRAPSLHARGEPGTVGESMELQAARSVIDALISFTADARHSGAAECGARLAELGISEEEIAGLLPALLSAWEAEGAGVGPQVVLAGDFMAAVLAGAAAHHREQRMRDLELLSRARAETDQTDRLLGVFAHDLNNVLTAISGFLQLLLLEAEPDSPLHADIMKMKGVVGRGADLIMQIRHLSKRSQEPQEQSPPAGDGALAAGSASVLVVDDEPAVRDVMARTLAARGYTVHSVGSGAEALSLFADRAYDCVVLDVIMPNLGGMETLERMKAARPYVPVLVVTGSAAEGLRGRLHAQGADSFMEKPLDFTEFAERVRALMAGKTGG